MRPRSFTLQDYNSAKPERMRFPSRGEQILDIVIATFLAGTASASVTWLFLYLMGAL